MGDVVDFDVFDGEDDPDPVLFEVILDLCKRAKAGEITNLIVVYTDEAGSPHVDSSLSHEPLYELTAVGALQWAANELLCQVE